jgi:hypothetical protein
VRTKTPVFKSAATYFSRNPLSRNRDAREWSLCTPRLPTTRKANWVTPPAALRRGAGETGHPLVRRFAGHGRDEAGLRAHDLPSGERGPANVQHDEPLAREAPALRSRRVDYEPPWSSAAIRRRRPGRGLGSSGADRLSDYDRQPGQGGEGGEAGRI